MKIVVLNTPYLSMYSRASRSPAVTKSSTLYYPIYLAYATGVLEQDRHEVKLIDCPAMDWDKEEAYKFIPEFKPDMVVVNTTTASIFSDTEVAESVKKIDNSFVVMVGTHATVKAKEILGHAKRIDAVARAEYDFIIRDLAGALEEDGDLSQVRGLTYRKGNKIIENPDMPKIDDLDSLPFVSKVYERHLSPYINRYFYEANQQTTHAETRGQDLCLLRRSQGS